MDIEKVLKDISDINFTGNIIPHTWYKHVIYATEGGKEKADLLAINILADVVYWHRLSVIRDESTGQVIEYRKKFKADKLQKSYNSYAEQFGSTKRAVKYSIDLLVKLNLIKRDFEDLKDIGLFNVMYLTPIPEKIKEISDVEGDKINTGGILPNLATPPAKNGNTSNQKRGYPVPKKEGDITKNSDTNTKITSEISSESFYLIVIGALKDKKFQKAFREFCDQDDQKYLDDKMYWIDRNAKKYESSVKDIIDALNICIEDSRYGQMDYFTGILRNKAAQKGAGLTGHGKPFFVQVEQYLRERIGDNMQFIKQYDLDLDAGLLYYSIHSREDREAVEECMRMYCNDIKVQFDVELLPKFRL